MPELLPALLQDKPTGEVGQVCWMLMGAIVTGAGIVIKWLSSKLDATEKKVEALHAARSEDRDKFEAQTNVLVNTILAKKRGESPQ